MKDRQKSTRVNDPNALVAPEPLQLPITCRQVIYLGTHGSGEHQVILGVGGNTRDGHEQRETCRGADEAQVLRGVGC